jgi:hypothetical protein
MLRCRLRRTAAYFGMRYRGCAYLYTGMNIDRRSNSERALVRFGERISVYPSALKVTKLLCCSAIKFI